MNEDTDPIDDQSPLDDQGDGDRNQNDSDQSQNKKSAEARIDELIAKTKTLETKLKERSEIGPATATC